VVEHDVCEPIALEVDQIYNLACPASPEHYQRDPIFTTKTCVIGAMNMLELARQNGAPILQASTSEVYGDPTVHPQPETYNGHVNPIGPRACYDEGKRCAETLFFDYRRVYGVDIKVARIFNTYGPRMQEDDGRVVSNFVTQALEDEPITVYGRGEQTRSFCYVDDLIEGLILFMNSSESGPINFGNPDEYTIHELAELILNKTEAETTITYAPFPQDDPKKRRPLITVAEAKLNWTPKVTLQEGLDQMIAHYSKKMV
jgi:UDP-glucuronate decarboxylase